MYVRVNQVKFPNKMAKEAVQNHAKNLLTNFGENSRLIRLTVDISDISHLAISVWKDKESYKKYGSDEMNRFQQMEKEMGAVESFSEGKATGEISKFFDKSLFEEK